MTDETVRLPSGASVRVRDFIVFRGNAGSTLTIVVQGRAEVHDVPRTASEAQELANVVDEFARRKRIDRIAINICETAECLANSARATMIFYFRRAADGLWAADGVIINS